MSDEVMMNATPIDQLPSAPLSIPVSDQESSNQKAGTSYADILLSLQKLRQAPTTASQVVPQSDTPNQNAGAYADILSSIQTAKQTATPNFKQHDMHQDMSPTPQMLMQSPVNPSSQNIMQQIQAQAGMYEGEMPQSSPISEYMPNHTMSPVHTGPLKSTLLPDPMFFQTPPQPRKVKKVYIEKEAPKPPTFFGFDQTKLKSAVLVSAIVFILISYVAPLLAKSMQWTVNYETGKFTAAGLLVISVLTGGLYLGFVSIIDKFGNGVS